MKLPKQFPITYRQLPTTAIAIRNLVWRPDSNSTSSRDRRKTRFECRARTCCRPSAQTHSDASRCLSSGKSESSWPEEDETTYLKSPSSWRRNYSRWQCRVAGWQLKTEPFVAPLTAWPWKDRAVALVLLRRSAENWMNWRLRSCTLLSRLTTTSEDPRPQRLKSLTL